MAWENFLKSVERAKVDLRCHAYGAWYRGVPNCKYRLYPSLFRPRSPFRRQIGPGKTKEYRAERLRLKELSIYDQFGDEFPDAARAVGSSWERLVTMQHHGCPTRLLDWTEVFGYALFFALQVPQGTRPKSPAIWIVNPFTLAQKARGSEEKTIGKFHDDSRYDYHDNFLKSGMQSWPFARPMPYRPPKLLPRIRAQRGFFTVHGTDPKPLETIFPEAVRQVRLPLSALAEARRFLDLAGINNLTMYPDFQGFVDHVKKNYE